MKKFTLLDSEAVRTEHTTYKLPHYLADSFVFIAYIFVFLIFVLIAAGVEDTNRAHGHESWHRKRN